MCGGERYTYKMTYDRACAFAEALMQSGLKSGDTAAVSLPRSIDMI
ncbi:MAG: AMP-binding protein [Ruminococcus sp.]|nr:AMP-binding protein [Ruminococcus sp.]